MGSFPHILPIIDGMAGFGLAVKNTFLELADDSFADARATRSSSVPPSFRFATEQRTLRSLDKADLCSSTNGDTLSTEGDLFSDACSACTRYSDMSDVSSVGASDSASNIRPPPLVDPAIVAAYNFVRVMQPMARARVDPWEAFRALAVTAMMALTATGLAFEPLLNRSCFGWQVVAKLPQEHMAQKDLLLSAAKLALLRAAEQSQGTYVLGYGRTPFVLSPLGFSALLGHVDNDSEACWDLLERGCCDYEGCCRWQHPSARATINVMVVPAGAVATIAGSEA